MIEQREKKLQIKQEKKNWIKRRSNMTWYKLVLAEDQIFLYKIFFSSLTYFFNYSLWKQWKNNKTKNLF